MSLSMHLWVGKYSFAERKMWIFLLGIRNSSLHVETNILTSLTLLYSCYISFPLEGTKELIPCVSSQTVSTQANNGLRNAGLHTQRQMSGNGWTFPGSNAQFQISRDHRIMFLLECGLDFTFQRGTMDVENGLFCSAIWRRVFSKTKHFWQGRVGCSAEYVQKVSQLWDGLKVSH